MMSSTITARLRLRFGRQPRRGFTLIELLIVAAVFSVAFLLGTTIFVNVQSNQRGVAGRQRIVSDGRYILEAMARTIRLGSIDYQYYRNPDGNALTNDAVNLTLPQTTLAIRDQLGAQTCFRLNGIGLQTVTAGQSTCFLTATPTTITPSDIAVTTFQVIISPASDPFLGTRTAQDCLVPLNTDGVCPCSDIRPTATPADNLNDDTDIDACLPQQRCVATSGGPEICLNVNRQPAVSLVLETQNTNVRSGEQSSIALQTTVTPRTLRR